jgi:hypothetical protein
MASISWAELYFRSLKRIDVLPIVTRYLIQYKKVCIPHIGTFELVQEPPQLDVADKVFRPPYFITRYRNEDAVTDHQWRFLGSQHHELDLSSFGQKLKNNLRKAPFDWNGFGTLRYSASGIVFDPKPIDVPGYTPVRAEKVMRENVKHSMLVGDTQMNSDEVSDALNKPGVKTPLFMIIGWALLALALIAILVWLYLNHFQTGSSGLRLPG